MARTKKKVGKKPARKRVRNMSKSAGLDGPAAAYARLLADPCNSALVHPIYPGGDAGFLFRAESFVTIGTAAGDTAGYMQWSPGYVNSSLTQMVYQSTASGAVPSAALAGGSFAPANTFLSTNAKGARCIAACVKVTFPGAENVRSGRVHFGHVNAGTIDLGSVVSPDGVAQCLQHYTRTPADTIEIVWKPNFADVEMNDPSEAASAVIRDRKSAVAVAWAGLPAATGMVFHFTAVYEWTPVSSIGIGHNALGKAISSNSLDQVIDVLIKGGFKFVRHAGMAMANTLLGGVTQMLDQQYGRIRAAPRTRATVTF